MEGYATRRQIAEFLQISEKTLAQWAVRRIGPPFRKFGTGRSSAVRYCWADVHEWVKQQPSTSEGVLKTPLKEPKMHISFNRWLRSQMLLDDLVGDLARDMENDPDWPNGASYAVQQRYLRDKGADPFVLQALKEARNRYRRAVCGKV